METLKEEIIELESNGRHWVLRYALLAEPAGERMGFGLFVCNETTGEQAMIRDALIHQCDGETLLSRLVAGRVTPVSLHEVVEDFVAEIG